MIFLVNAIQIFENGNPKNFIPKTSTQRIARIVNNSSFLNNAYPQ